MRSSKKRKTNRGPRFINLKGKRFGKLKVIKFFGFDKFHHSLWTCRCDCGETTRVMGSNLSREISTKCGYGVCNSRRISNQAKTICKKMNVKFLDKQYLRIREKHNFLCLKHHKKCVSTLESLKTGRHLKCCDKERKESRTGSLAGGWNPNLTEIERRVAKNRYLVPEYWSWNRKVKEVGFCQICAKTYKLESHHINGFKNSSQKERTSLNNGICLCKKCHDIFHEEYGRKDFDFNDYEEFEKDYSIFIKQYGN